LDADAAAIFAALVFGGYGAAYNAQDFIYTRF
jgi:enhancing lycopene biosynthesis protein 2